MSTAWNIASHSAVLLPESAAPRTANHSFTLARASGDCCKALVTHASSSRPTACRKARTCGSVLIVTAIQPSAVRKRLIVRVEQALIARRPDRRIEAFLRKMLLHDESCHGLEHRDFKPASGTPRFRLTSAARIAPAAISPAT